MSLRNTHIHSQFLSQALFSIIKSSVFEDGNCLEVSSVLKNKTNDSERGDVTKGKHLHKVDMLH